MTLVTQSKTFPEDICPACGETKRTRRLRDARNLVRIVGNTLLTIIVVVIDTFALGEGFPLRRVCLKCGTRFVGDRTLGRRLDECAQCKYSLIGNVSGVCPECGWRLPRDYRRFVRAAHRSSKADDRM